MIWKNNYIIMMMIIIIMVIIIIIIFNNDNHIIRIFYYYYAHLLWIANVVNSILNILGDQTKLGQTILHRKSNNFTVRHI